MTEGTQYWKRRNQNVQCANPQKEQKVLLNRPRVLLRLQHGHGRGLERPEAKDREEKDDEENELGATRGDVMKHMNVIRF